MTKWIDMKALNQSYKMGQKGLFCLFKYVSYIGLSLVIMFHLKYPNTAHDAPFIEFAARVLLYMGHLLHC